MSDIRSSVHDGLELLGRDGRSFAWIRGATIRVGGFDTEPEAIDAALHGGDLLDAWRIPNAADDAARAPATAPVVRLVHDGAYQWIVRGRRPLARLLRPSGPRARDGNAPAHDGARYALEFVIPVDVPATARVSIARRLLHVVASGPLPPPAA